jgi:hypothetical protein
MNPSNIKNMYALSFIEQPIQGSSELGAFKLVPPPKFSPEKFAELIVDECINAVLLNGMNEESYHVRIQAAEDIKSRLGICKD